MATVTIYDKDNNRSYSMTVNFLSSLTNTNAPLTQEGQGRMEYYLSITTTLPDPDGNAFPTYYVKTLADVPPGYPTAVSFDELVRYYLEYFQSVTIYESSSSESSSDSSSLSSSDSSSEYYTTSSDSSSVSIS